MNQKFWDKVSNCKHEATDNYYIQFNCGTPYCTVTEYHCKHCGAYIQECGCGSNDGISGWSYKRWKNFNDKKLIDKILNEHSDLFKKLADM
jgi:hypothetical protein